MRLLEEMKELTQLRGISGCEDEVLSLIHI